MNKISCSLCIATYNWPEALRICLDSVMKQTHMPSEVIICDDGSGEATASVIKAFQEKSPIPIIHIWQPDEGFQLARIRNKGFAVANGDYIIQTDGDLIFHHDFIKSHMHFARKGSFLSGSRVPMNELLSNQILESKKVQYPSVFNKQIGKKYNALNSPLLASLHLQFSRKKRKYNYVLGCNMSFWKEDLLKVNGYDESYKGWGKEDNDIAVRLLNAGTDLKFLKYSGIAYHFYHKEAERKNLDENIRALEQTIHAGKTWIEKGISQYP